MASAGLRLRYLECCSGSGGGGGGDVVLLLHDAGEAAEVWLPTVAPRLAQRGYRVLALDLRGAVRGVWWS